MSFRVVMTAHAKAEVDVIYDFIAEHSDQEAIRWLRAFQVARDELGENPERFG